MKTLKSFYCSPIACAFEECIIPNPASVKLLADPFCAKHPACKAG